jgi:peptidoglycan/xylan/chitin deacetylase (PgdA/CDA1 family)
MRVRWFLPLLALLFAAAPAAAEKRIALTFDDVPRNSGAFLTPDRRTKMLIAGLRKAGVRQAAFFINPSQIGDAVRGDGAAHIRAYVAAGHVIADHSFTHPHLTGLSAEAYLADIDRAEKWLKAQPGRRPWFRFPFLDEGGRDKAKRDAVRAGLAARGLRNGYVTVDGYDWNIEALTVAAARAHKRIDMKALHDLYVETMVGAADFFDGLARRTLDRSPAHVLLLHETDLAALFIPDLVKALRQDGWRIVTADEAYADPIAAAMPDVPSAQGTLTEALAWEKGLPAPRWYERNETPIANALFASRVLHEPVDTKQ